MSRILHSFSSRWVLIALVVGGVCRVYGDEMSKEGTSRSSAVSRASATELAGDAASKALAITKRDQGDGTRIVQVIEEDTMVRISERPGQGITVIVVETVRGSEKVNRYTAPNVLALKARQPRGYEFYERYANADPMAAVAKAEGDVEKADTDAAADKQLQMLRDQLARYETLIRQMQHRMVVPRQGGFQGGLPQSGFQQAGGAVKGGAWAGSSAWANSSASSSANSSSSSGSSQSGRGR